MKVLAALPALSLVLAGCANVSQEPPPAPKVVAVVAATATATTVTAKTFDSTIEGTVLDDGGTPLPGVTVTMRGPGGFTRSVVTDAQGKWTASGLPAGLFEMRFELAGFSPVIRPLPVKSADTMTLYTRMKVSALSETITVTSSAPALRVSASTAGYVVGGVEGGVVGGVVGGTVGGMVSGRMASPFQMTVKAEREKPLLRVDEFTKATDQPVTTFAIDVDRASYANVRASLNGGQVPEADQIRLEELINYFPYAYPQPHGDDPLSITTEAAACPWAPSHRLVRIGLQGRDLEAWKAAPNNLVFLIDVSGSMSGPESLPLVIQGLRKLVDQLRAEDRVAIVVYAGAAGLVLPSTSGADKQTIVDALSRLEAGGSTAGAAGIELAYQVAKENFLTEGNNRVILATDGDFNVGQSTDDELTDLIEEKRKDGIYLTLLGVGSGSWKDATMELLADKGNGNYSYLDSLAEAEKVFVRELTGTLVTIAKDVKVQVEFDPRYVASYRQIGYENRALANKDFDDDTKDAGELGAGHSVTALFEIEPRGLGRGEIATVRVRYQPPSGKAASKLLTATVRDEGRAAWEASTDMRFATAVAEFGMLLRGSKLKGDAKWADVEALTRQSIDADLDGYRKEFLELVAKATKLQGGTPEVVKSSSLAKRGVIPPPPPPPLPTEIFKGATDIGG